MAFVFDNYGTLKTEIADWLAKKDPALIAKIPTFVALAERRIMRQLRIPTMERIAEWIPTPGGGGFGAVAVPTDYLEAKIMLHKGNVQRRISDLELLQSLHNKPAGHHPKQFARVAQDFKFFPPPDGEYDVHLVYYADYSGLLVDDDDTHDVYKAAPDLYLYGSLLAATPYLKNDKRLGTWAGLFTAGLDALNNMSDEDETAGSPQVVRGAVRDY